MLYEVITHRQQQKYGQTRVSLPLLVFEGRITSYNVCYTKLLRLKEGGNVLLLDEPSNDLDVETLRALEDALLEFPGCVLVISHDRWFLDRIATHILAFEGDSQVVWFEGNYSEYEEDRKRRLGIV